MTKREKALNLIRYEYAIHGRETRESKRAYIENRVSFEARLRAVSEGLRLYNKNQGE